MKHAGAGGAPLLEGKKTQAGVQPLKKTNGVSYNFGKKTLLEGN